MTESEIVMCSALLCAKQLHERGDDALDHRGDQRNAVEVAGHGVLVGGEAQQGLGDELRGGGGDGASSEVGEHGDEVFCELFAVGGGVRDATLGGG